MDIQGIIVAGCIAVAGIFLGGRWLRMFLRQRKSGLAQCGGCADTGPACAACKQRDGGLSCDCHK